MLLFSNASWSLFKKPPDLKTANLNFFMFLCSKSVSSHHFYQKDILEFKYYRKYGMFLEKVDLNKQNRNELAR